ncbi:MAG: hypothetical protein ACXW6J_05500, partial [Candidatus Binatia bacterium]
RQNHRCQQPEKDFSIHRSPPFILPFALSDYPIYPREHVGRLVSVRDLSQRWHALALTQASGGGYNLRYANSKTRDFDRTDFSSGLRKGRSSSA